MKDVRMLRWFCAFAAVAAGVGIGGNSLGQASGEVVPVNPALNARDDAYLERQAEALLGAVRETLGRVRPHYPEPRERRLALLLLDALLHEMYAPNRPAVQRFYHAQMEEVAVGLEGGRVEEGAMIWKLYNHGFIVRTATVTLAFDFHRGARGFRVDDPVKGRQTVESAGFPVPLALMERIVGQCDVLFISHRHGDHADPDVARAFLEQGKPVVAPDEVFAGDALQSRITHLPREAHTLQELPVQNGERTLSLVVYPGQQYQGSGVPNNVALVFTPEGMSFAHNGDQINDPYPAYQEDFKWIDRVREHHKVDVLMTNCWTNDILRIVRGFDPRLVLPGHENELGHPLWDRVPYWGDSEYLELNYPELLASSYPVVVMTWGEVYHYKPAAR